MKRIWWALILGLVATCYAQERHNFLAINSAIIDDAGPYYFVAHGDSSNAFARAQPFADALGLGLRFDSASKTLVFSLDGRQAVLQTTSDIADGLRKRDGVFTVDGRAFARPVPKGILVDGSSYVAVTPVVEAFFGADAIGWHADARVITVETPPPTVQLGTPRIGNHEGFTRVAFDLPGELAEHVAVDGGRLVVSVDGASFAPFDTTIADGRVHRVFTANQGGAAILVIEASGAIPADGAGIRGDVTASGVFYVDIPEGIATGESGTRVAAATSGVQTAPINEPLAAAPAEPVKKVVVIDAGHGGHDPGAVSSYATEEDVVLTIALQLREHLEAEGIEVVLTRDRDSFLTLQDRSRFATTERNLFVSIHANAADSRNANGIETWVFGQPLDPSHIDQAIRENGGGELGQALTQEAAASINIAGELIRETQLNYSLSLAESVQRKLVAATGATDRGIKRNLFYVIRTARIPAVLVELGFVSNPEEGRKLATASYQRTLSRALADGILEFLSSGGVIASR